MAVRHRSGGELQLLTEFAANAGSPTVDTAQPLAGSAAVTITSLSSGTAKRVELATGTAGAGPFFYAIWLRVNTRPSAENRIIAVLDNTNASMRVYITHDNTGVLKLYQNDGTQIGSASSALSTGFWYLIEIEVKRVSLGNDTIKARINGTQFAGSTTANAASNFGRLRVGGNLNSEAQTTGTWYFDDFGCNDDTGSSQTSYIGNHHIVHLMPSAAGDNSDWTNDYTAVDEVPPNTSDFVASNTLNQIDDHNVQDTPSAIG